MKLAAALVSALACVSTVTAQAAHIRYPREGTKVHKGRDITIQLVRPVCLSLALHLVVSSPKPSIVIFALQNSIMGSREVGLVLSFQYCQKPNPCPPATNQLGSVLFIGQFNPQFHEIPGQPYQNFTVTIPDFDFWKPGPAQIIATRFHLIGVSSLFGSDYARVLIVGFDMG